MTTRESCFILFVAVAVAVAVVVVVVASCFGNSFDVYSTQREQQRKQAFCAEKSLQKRLQKVTEGRGDAAKRTWN